MKYYYIIFLGTLFLLLMVTNNVCAGDVDNRIILEKIESLSKRMDDKFDSVNRRFDAINSRFDAVNQRIDDLRDSLNKRIDDSRSYDIAIIIAIISLMALIIWDRRNALKPINDQFREMKERLDLLWEQFQADKKEGLQNLKPA